MKTDSQRAVATDDGETLAIDESTFRVIAAARQFARQSGAPCIDETHLLLGALEAEATGDSRLRALLTRSGLKWDELRLYAGAATDGEMPVAIELTPLSGGESLELELSDRAVTLMQTATVEARGQDPDASHIFIACLNLEADSPVTKVLAPLEIDANQLRFHLKQLRRADAEKAALAHHPLAILAPDGEAAIDAAQTAMRASFCGRISTLHLLIGILENPENEAVQRLENSGINVEQLRIGARAAIVHDGQIAGPKRLFTPAAKRALERAKDAVYNNQNAQIGSVELWQGLQPHRVFWLEIFQFGWKPDDPAAALLAEVAAPKTTARSSESSSIPFTVLLLTLLITGLLLRTLQWQDGFTRLFARNFIYLAVTVAMGASFLVAIAVSIFSPDATRKRTCWLAFIGALLGSIGMYLIGLY